MSPSGAIEWLRQPVFGPEASNASRDKALKAADERNAQLKDDPSKALLRWVAKLGAGIVSGLGVAGVVSLIGAAVIWVRFDQAGLPSTQALDVVPNSQLTVDGGVATISGLLLGTLAVLVLFSLDRTGQITRASALALGLLWLGGVIYAGFGTDLACGAVFLIAVLGLVLVGASVGIGKVTGDRFVPFAAAVFVSAAVFAGATSLEIAAQQDFVQPAAVLRSPEGEGIRGFYIADTDDFIYLGVIRQGFVPDGPGDAVPMYRIPRDDETRLLIGKLQPYGAAVAESEDLRLQLKETEQTDDPLPAPVP